MSSTKKWQVSRRAILRGMGVSLALPWLESLPLSKAVAQAQVASPIKRYMLMYFPCGVAQRFWYPEGSGTDWSFSALLEPLAPYKQHIQVIRNAGQEALFNMGKNPNPSHSLYCAPSFSCTVPDQSEPILGGPTVDQMIAQHIGGDSKFRSLQVGCSTMNSNPDGRHPAITRSVSWEASDRPLYKEVNPQKVFDTLIAQLASNGAVTPEAQAAAELRKARDLSVLDFVIDEASSLNTKLSKSDRNRLDQFLTSVREIEQRTQSQGTAMPVTSKVYTRPSLSATYYERRPGSELMEEADGYNRGEHAEVMNDLITMAFETNLTNVITHMLDDARSEYQYKHLKQRTFEGMTSVEDDAQLESMDSGDLLGYHGLSHAGDNNNGFATVNYFFVQKFASLLDRLSKSMEADGSSVLDNTIITFMSGMKGSSHELTELPVVLAGGGSVFKTGYYNDFDNQLPLANIHLTIMRRAFGMDINELGYSTGEVPELLL